MRQWNANRAASSDQPSNSHLLIAARPISIGSLRPVPNLAEMWANRLSYGHIRCVECTNEPMDRRTADVQRDAAPRRTVACVAA
ncbi:hypothetical protein EMIT0158MI4_100069 [Burkholderia ambifaria]